MQQEDSNITISPSRINVLKDLDNCGDLEEIQVHENVSSGVDRADATSKVNLKPSRLLPPRATRSDSGYKATQHACTSVASKCTSKNK